MVENLVQRKLGTFRYSLEILVGTMTGLGFVSSVLLFSALLFSSFASWSWIGLAISIPLTGVGVLILKLPYFGRMDAERRDIAKNYPSMICELRLKRE